MTLDSIAEKKKQLEAELLKLHEQEQRLIDLKSLKIVRCWEGKGILISKEGGSVALSIDDCEELVIRIDDMLKSAQQN